MGSAAKQPRWYVGGVVRRDDTGPADGRPAERAVPRVTLSIIVPVYNEQRTLEQLLQRVERVPLDKEILVVDDGSTDSTPEILRRFGSRPGFTLLRHERNFGKGRAIRTALDLAAGAFVVIQDADLEYDPQELVSVIQPLQEGRARVVYGSRRLGKESTRHSGVIYLLGGLFVTYLARWLYRLEITDEATCYKMFDRELLRSLHLSCERFEFCPEVTAKLAKRRVPITEVAISYSPRRKAEGKKIGWLDALEAVWTLLRIRAGY